MAKQSLPCRVPPEFLHLRTQELVDTSTISVGHVADLKIDKVVGKYRWRIWLSRLVVTDGVPYPNMVMIEALVNGNWKFIKQYKATGKRK